MRRRPALTYLTTVKVEVGEPIEVGNTIEGFRRVIPITCGSVEGPELRGAVLAVGADYQLLKSGSLTELESKYVIETEDGERP
jgi:hypothetical protein